MASRRGRETLFALATASLVLSLGLLLQVLLAETGPGLSAVLVRIDDRARVLVLPCGSPVILGFNNSVTGSPVEILLRVCGSFEGVEMITDSAGAEYYSQGVLDVNGSIRSFRSSVIVFCTGLGARISIGGVAEAVGPGSCAHLEVLRIPGQRLS